MPNLLISISLLLIIASSAFATETVVETTAMSTTGAATPDGIVRTSYPDGSYFLSDDVASFSSTFSYFFGIEGGEKEMYQPTWNQCFNTGNLINQLRQVWMDSGAHDFRTVNPYGGGTFLNMPFTYSNNDIASISFGGTLVLYINRQSAAFRGNNSLVRYNIMDCMALGGTAYDCVSTQNQLMIQHYNDVSSQMVLPAWDCLSNGVLAAIIVPCVVGGIIIICLLYCFRKRICPCKRNKYGENDAV